MYTEEKLLELFTNYMRTSINFNPEYLNRVNGKFEYTAMEAAYNGFIGGFLAAHNIAYDDLGKV